MARAVALVGFEGGGHLLLGAGSIAGDRPDVRIGIAPQPVEGGTYHRIVVHGSAGRLTIDGDRPVNGRPLVRLDRGGDSEVVFSAADFDQDPGFSAVDLEVAAMIDCLEQPGLAHPLEAGSARDTLEILIAIYESSRRRQAVRLPLDDVKDNPLIAMLSTGIV